MRLSIRIARIVALLGLLFIATLAVSTVAGRLTGDRVYLINKSRCALAVMDEHDGVTVGIDETVLVKSGLFDRTPTMVIAPSQGMWFGGVHFSSGGKISVRGYHDLTVPPSWIRQTLLGTEITYEITSTAQIVVHQYGVGQLQAQPSGFPIESNTNARGGSCGV